MEEHSDGNNTNEKLEMSEEQRKAQEYQDQVFSLQRQLQQEKAIKEHGIKINDEGLHKRTTSLIEGDEDSIGLRGKEVAVDLRTNLDKLTPIPKDPKKKKLLNVEVSNLSVAVKYVITDTKKHKRAWCIGFFTVFLVVAFITLLQNAIGRSPIIFLKLGEDQVGEYDLLMTPLLSNNELNFWLNFTELESKINSGTLVEGSAPRWAILGRVFNADQSLSSSSIILIMDDEREKNIGLGREWSAPPLGRNEIHVSNTVLRSLGVTANAGQSVILEFDFIGMLQTLGVTGGKSVESFLTTLIEQNLSQNLNGINLSNVTVGELIHSVQQFLNLPNVDFIDLIKQLFDVDLSENLTLNLSTFLEEGIANLRQNLIIRREYLVMDGIESPDGKYPSSLGNVAILEANYVGDLVNQTINTIKASDLIPDLTPIKQFLPFLTPETRQIVESFISFVENSTSQLDNLQNNFHIQDYALSVIVMYKDRLKTYVKSLNDMNADLIVFTNQVSDLIGYQYPATFTLPLQATLTPLYFLRLFLDQIFLFVAVVLIFLGALLIYSLLLSNVEEKTYEYGMLRALGMKHYVLIQLLTIQSLSFSIPGIVFGLIAAFLLYIPVAYLISNFSAIPKDLSLSFSAALYGVILGLIMPLIAIISPIQRALSRTLRDALDVYHQVQSEVTVRVIKLEKMGLSPWQTTASVLMIIMGFVVYYIIPYSFTFQNLPLFFTTLALILLCMLFGLSLIGQTLEPYLERLGVWLIIWGPDRRTISPLVIKNLSAHSKRNLKTSTMFTTSLSFIIFAGVSFSLQGNTIANVTKLASGADLLVLSPSSPLNEKDMTTYLNNQINQSNPLVLSYTYVTPQITSYDFLGRVEISSLAGYPSFRVLVHGVEENFLDSTYSEFYIPTQVSSQFEYNKTEEGEANAIQSLYVHQGQAILPQEKDGIEIPPDITSQRNHTSLFDHTEAYTKYIDVVVSESLRLSASIDINTPLMLSVRYRVKGDAYRTRIYLCKIRALISKAPGFFFSSYRQTALFSPVLVTMDQYYRILNETYYARDVEEPRTVPLDPKPAKQKLQVKLRSGLKTEEREIIVNGLRNFIDDDITQIVSTVDLVSSTDVAIEMLTIFFNIVAVIAIVLCFFVLWLSFTANVNENAWEFGVLRAIGLNSATVIRIYIYEAMSLIFSSVVVGSVVGILVAVTLTLQFNLFSEFAFSFAFPYALFFSVLGMAVVVAIFGSYIPAYSLRKKDIATALKNM